MNGTIQLDRLLDVHEAAEVMRVSVYTIRAWIRQGKLKATKLGRLVRLEPREVMRLISGGRLIAKNTSGKTVGSTEVTEPLSYEDRLNVGEAAK